MGAGSAATLIARSYIFNRTEALRPTASSRAVGTVTGTAALAADALIAGDLAAAEATETACTNTGTTAAGDTVTGTAALATDAFAAAMGT